MQMLSDDDMNLREMSDDELTAAWDLWFDLAQTTNDADPPYTHGVFVNLTWDDLEPATDPPASDRPTSDRDGRAATRSDG